MRNETCIYGCVFVPVRVGVVHDCISSGGKVRNLVHTTACMIGDIS